LSLREKQLFKAVDRYVGIPLVAVLGWLWRLGELLRVPARPLGPGSRVLVVKLSALGDTLLLLPCLEALRAQVGPQGRLEFLCSGVNAAALEGLPWVDQVHRFEPGRPWALLGLLAGLRRKRFHLGLDYDQWLRVTPLLLLAAGTRRRAGFDSPGQHRRGLYNAWAPQRRGEHECDAFNALTRAAGCNVEPAPYGGFIAARGLYGASAMMARGGGVLIHAGCGGKGWQREWPEERWAALAQALQARGLTVRLSGSGPREAAQNGRIIALSGGAAQAAPQTPGLAGLCALLQSQALLISGNTGVMHLAAGLGVPLLALHGPTDPVKWGPRALPGRAAVLAAAIPCSPCLFYGFDYACPRRDCMESLTLAAAESAALSLLAAA
jgi:ADP-heptose:LPS heptosyltransferase